ncbi:uncharacterized protein N7459_005305 [Penicillium hispanicum]|uniref:uncharacterized protein n=1 Tax=Penicillium hispanicum TaxID=1080232 RepID=UPI0025421936|nr:uncharacterized protein N7459_005305 [Penicillium hispanicum]KAJ5585505.1 hypothetical protein N7459_005305 [Penicillium hispanicum]
MRPFLPQGLGLRPLRSLTKTTSSLASTRSFFSRSFSQFARPQHRTPTSILCQSRRIVPSTYRQNSTSPRPLTEESPNQEPEAERERKNAERRKNEEAYLISFTCKPCGERSTHRMSKQGYHRGTVLIQCPSCKSRHVMSDHLGIFFDKSTTLEDLLKQNGQALTHGRTDGDLEFWEDGTMKKLDNEGLDALGHTGKGST